MIHDQIGNVGLYLPPKIREQVEKYLSETSAYSNGEVTEIIGSEAFGKLMEYPTHEAGECKIEAHNEYVDLQFTLDGAEGISIFERDRLDIISPIENDVCFLEGEVQPVIQVKNTVGYFTLIFPWEAHRPQEKITSEGYVKKGVIKIKEKFFHE